jgi:hypothetical protein
VKRRNENGIHNIKHSWSAIPLSLYVCLVGDLVQTVDQLSRAYQKGQRRGQTNQFSHEQDDLGYFENEVS